MSCEPRVTVKPTEPERAAPDAFVQAEAHAARNEPGRAVEAYAAFVQQHPGSGKAPVALQRMADIHAARGDLGTSLAILEMITELYPDYPDLAAVSFRMVEQLHALEQFARSRDQAYRWMEAYPDHPLVGKVLNLLGEDLLLLGDRPGAFLWWLKAVQEGLLDPAGETRIRERLMDLIDTSPVETLKEMAPYAADTPYHAALYYRIASLNFQRGNLEGAREAVGSLLRSTGDEMWLAAGEEMLARIHGRMPLRKCVIGCLLPLTGPFAIYGQEVLNGIRLGLGLPDNAAEQDPAFELVVRDTGGEPEQAVRGLEELVEQEKAMAVIGPLSSKTAPAAARRAQELGVPLITLTQKADITLAGDMIFRNFLTPSMEVNRLLNAAMGDLAIQRFAILHPDNSYGRTLALLFWEGVEERGGEIAAVESYDPNETDFEAQIKNVAGLGNPGPSSVITRLKKAHSASGPGDAEESANPDAGGDSKGPGLGPDAPTVDFEAVFIPDNYQRVAMVAPQLLFHDVRDVQLLGTSLWQSPRLLDLAGDYVQSALFPSGFVPFSEAPPVAEFVMEYEAGYGATPGILGASGYDTVRILKKLMAEPDCATRRDLRQRLLSMEPFQGVTGDISFDENGEVRKDLFLLRVSGRCLNVVN